MKKQLTLILAGAAVAVGAVASPLTPEQALERYRMDGPAKSRGINVSDLRLSHTARSASGQPVAYVFAGGTGKGFAILSADDVALPVLGYSDTGSFDESNIPPQLKWWLSEMGRRMESVAGGDNAGSTKVYAPAEWAVIEPLCKTKWNQDAPYNKETPVVNDTQSPTGCVATSFAQAMNYFQYPERGEGVIQYKLGNKNLRLNLALKAFEWDKMLDAYTGSAYTDEEADAVAYLMKACGYTVEMAYGQYSSGALSYKLIDALVNNFKYDANVRYEDRIRYSSSQWSKMIYDNIKNCGPVIYDGTSLEGGHSFICDGYDGKGYFHFNWGWGGISDGYYLLDVLNPEAQGTGGSVGGFNWDQNAVIGMQKPTGEPVRPNYGNLAQYGTTVATLSGNVINFGVENYNPLGWGNGSYKPIEVNVGAIFENLATGETIDQPGVMGILGGTVSLNRNQYYSQENLHPSVTIPSGLSDGIYKVTLATQDCTEEGAPWQPILVTYGYNNWCTLTIEKGEYKITNASFKTLAFEDVNLNETLYYDRNTMLRAKVTNNSDLDLWECIQPVLISNGKEQFAGDMMIVSADAGESVDKEWIVKFYALNGADQYIPGSEYTLQLKDRTSGRVIGTYGTVTMDNVSGALSVTVNEFGVAGAERKDVVVGDRTFRNAYVVTSMSDFDIVFDYTVKTGYFDSSLRMGVQIYDPETNKSTTYLDEIYHAYPFLGKGDTDKVVVDMNMTGAPVNAAYTVRATYVQNGTQRTLSSMTFTFDGLGVDGIEADAEDGVAEYYSLQGVRLDQPEKGQVVICRKNGKTHKIVF